MFPIGVRWHLLWIHVTIIHTSCSFSGVSDMSSFSCFPGRFLTPRRTCLPQCPAGTFGNKTSGQCEGCSAGCAVCQEAKACQVCQKGLYLQEDVCVKECQRCFCCCLSSWFCTNRALSWPTQTPFLLCLFPRGFPQGEVCHPCAAECASCEESSSRCLSCEGPFLLLDCSCVSSCPKGFYQNNTECSRCPDHCSECSQDGLCEGKVHSEGMWEGWKMWCWNVPLVLN